MPEKQDGRNDFDFFVGTWKGHNRRLRERLKGSNDWEVFEGRNTMRKILGGLGNFDEVTFFRETGQTEGATLRLYNPESQEWVIHWASPTGNSLCTPMVGRFENGVGLFYAHELNEGRHVFVRFIWTVESERACRWEQAFSADGGQTWETNWTADFVREG